MEILIKEKHIPNKMTVVTADNLIGRISKLLNIALPLIPTKGYAINLYLSRPYSYIAFSGEYSPERGFLEGIQKSWVDLLPDGNRIGRRAPVRPEEFLTWVSEQPVPVQEEVRKNLEEYIAAPPETEKFPEPRHLFGY